MANTQSLILQRPNKSFQHLPIHIETHPLPSKPIRRNLFQWHWHDYYELEIFLSGCGIERMNNQTLQVKRGSMTLITPIGCHEVELDDDAIVCNIQFTGTGMSDSLLRRLQGIGGSLYIELEGQAFDNVLSVLHIMKQDYDHSLQDELQLMLEWLLLLLLRETEKQDGTPVYDEKMIEIINYIHHNFMDKVSVESLAKRFGYSATYMGTLFKNKIGMSIGTYLNNIRMNYAYSLLIGTDKTIDEISEQSGFCDRTYFSALFKKKYNQSPTECRLKHSKG